MHGLAARLGALRAAPSTRLELGCLSRKWQASSMTLSAAPMAAQISGQVRNRTRPNKKYKNTTIQAQNSVVRKRGLQQGQGLARIRLLKS